MNLSDRQKEIIRLVKNEEPITSKEIAERLNLSRSAIRIDLTVLTTVNILDAKPKKGYYYNERRYTLYDLERLYNIKCSAIMSRPVLLKEDDSIYQAIITLFSEDKGTVCVVDEVEQLYGIISRKDLLKVCMGRADLKNTPVSLAMTRMPNIVTIKAEDTYLEAASKIYNNKIDSLPVVNDQKKVLGYISKTTITRTLVEFGLKKGEVR